MHAFTNVLDSAPSAHSYDLIPSNLLTGAIDCALESMPKDLPTEAQELVQGMQLCSTFMASIMNNLLDVRKIEEGKMVLRSDPLSLEALVRDLCKMTLPAVMPGVELNYVAETEGRDCVLGDIHRLQVRLGTDHELEEKHRFGLPF